jgi:hypothetical protein
MGARGLRLGGGDCAARADAAGIDQLICVWQQPACVCPLKVDDAVYMSPTPTPTLPRSAPPPHPAAHLPHGMLSLHDVVPFPLGVLRTRSRESMGQQLFHSPSLCSRASASCGRVGGGWRGGGGWGGEYVAQPVKFLWEAGAGGCMGFGGKEACDTKHARCCHTAAVCCWGALRAPAIAPRHRCRQLSAGSAT